MRRFAMPNPVRSAVRVALPAAAALTLLVPAAASAGQATKVVAKQAQNATLGKTVLTTTKGRTLYSLSAETKGRFICTATCLSTWHPLLLPAGTKPKGPVKLGTIQRPEGTVQVTYRGLPLYTFAADKKRGQVKGDGLKDVGTWHPASVSGRTGSGTSPTGPGTY